MHTDKNLLVLAVAFVLLLLALAGRAPAAEITVTMKADVVANDGRCSLREAVTAANQNLASGNLPGECPAGDPRPAVDVIQLRRGKYKLVLGPAGEDGNVGGDLDVTESLVVQGRSQGATVIVNAIGDPLVAGDGDRLFHVDPSGLGDVDVTFARLALSRGDVGCSGTGCDPGASAVDARGAGTLTFDACTIMRGTATCFADGCGTPFGGAAIASVAGGSLVMRDSTIKKNDARCATEGCTISGAGIAMSRAPLELAPAAGAVPSELVIENGTLTQNDSSCDADFCGVGPVVSVSAATIAVRGSDVTSNRTLCEGAECTARGLLLLEADEQSSTVDDLELYGNAVECRGNTCLAGNLLAVGASGNTMIRGVSADTNTSSCTGARCYVSSQSIVVANFDVVTDGVVLTDSTASCTGIGCEVASFLYVASQTTNAIDDLRIERNQLGCVDEACVVGSLAELSGAPVDTTSSKLANNVVGCDGERCRAGSWLAMSAAVAAELTGSQLLHNELSCSGEECTTGSGAVALVDQGDLALPGLLVEENDLRCSGPACSASDLFALSASGAITIASSRTAFNELGCTGVLCRVGRLGNLDATEIALDSAVVTANTAACDGIACRAAGVVQVAATDARITRSLVTTNASKCDGDDCAAGPGAALRNSSRRLELFDSSLIGNATDGYGAAIFNDAGAKLELDRVFLTDNQAGLRGTMEFGGFGGAIFNDFANGAAGVMSIVNTEVRQNRALRMGGGVLNEGTIGRFERSVIAQNSVDDCVDRGGSGCP